METRNNPGRKLGLGLGDVPALAMVALELLRREEPERNLAPPRHYERPPPRISVVIPCGHGHEGLARTIRSVLAQEYPQSEIIVVDYGADAGARTVLGELGARVLALSSPKAHGEIGAIKAGFDAATGEYLVCLPAGDVLMSGALDRVRLTVRRKSYRVMWFCEMEDLEHAGERARPASARPGVSMRSLLGCDGPHLSAVAIRRTVYHKVAATVSVAPLAGVRDLWFRLACRTRFRRIEGSLGCRCTSARVIDEQDAERSALEFERSVRCLTRRMRWTARIMGVCRHILTRIDDAGRWVRSLWPSDQPRVAPGGEPSASAGSGERGQGPQFVGRDCLPG